MSAPTQPPTYKGEPLDAERGPGLGCFWIQIGLLVFFLILTPLTVVWAWDSRISAALLILTLVLLLFAGQTVIFLLRLVAADRRTRRAPRSPDARPTVGQLEELAEASAIGATADEASADPGSASDSDMAAAPTAAEHVADVPAHGPAVSTDAPVDAAADVPIDAAADVPVDAAAGGPAVPADVLADGPADAQAVPADSRADD